MTWLSSARTRVAPAAHWIVPSVVGACAGSLAGGVYDAWDADAFIFLATIGFFGLLALPVLIAGSAIVRGLWAAWQPRMLGASLVETGGGAPRLAGWVAVAWLGVVFVVWALYQGTWLLASWTAFKPLPVALAEAIIGSAAALIAAIVSRPVARLLAFLARKLDARWRRLTKRTMLAPRTIFAGAVLTGFVAIGLLWWLFVSPKLGPLDTSVLYAPAIAFVVAGVAHIAWRAVPRAGRRIAGPVLGAAAACSVAVALFALFYRPSQTLEIWGDRPIAGFAIDHLFDLDAIRADVALDEFRPVDRPGAAHPDIVLITIDTVRADHTPPYGGAAPMPVLKQMAERGTTFVWAFSPSNVTRRSIPSMAIGLDPNRIRGRVVGWALRVDPRHVLLAERLRAGGYETAGFMCCEGFYGSEARTGLARGLEHVENEKNGQKLAGMARAWLEAREHRANNRPLFLWMHILEPHDWSSVEIIDETERKRIYDHSLTASDGMLGVVLTAFADRAPEHAPIVIVSADHGEGLGEHGHPFHSTDLYNSQIRIPLVMVGPGIKQQRVDETVSLTDMVPTILDLAGFQPSVDPNSASPFGDAARSGEAGAFDAALDGRSIKDLATGARASHPYGTAFAAMIRDRSNPGGLTAIVRGNWKLIESENTTELYDLRADPDEHMNLVNLQIPIVHELKTLLANHVKGGDVSPFR